MANKKMKCLVLMFTTLDKSLLSLYDLIRERNNLEEALHYLALI